MIFIGNRKIVNLLDRSLKSGKIAQAYIFCGPESVGKFMLAKIFAEAIIYEKDITTILRIMVVNDKLNKKVEPLDRMIVEPEREEKRGVIKERDIKIEKLREARNFLLTYPLQGKFKVLVVNDAHRMTEAAQNSLLKILEEPNSTSVMILATDETSGILPTLQSRCVKINFTTVGKTEMAENLKKMGVLAESQTVDLAMGRPGVALNLAQNKEMLSEWKITFAELEVILKEDLLQKMHLAEAYSKNLPEALKKLDLWIWILRQKTYGGGSPAKGTYEKIEMIEKTVGELEGTNVSSRLALENLFISL